MAMQHKSEGSLGPEQEEGEQRRNRKNLYCHWTSEPADIFYSFTHFTPRGQAAWWIHTEIWKSA